MAFNYLNPQFLILNSQLPVPIPPIALKTLQMGSSCLS